MPIRRSLLVPQLALLMVLLSGCTDRWSTNVPDSPVNSAGKALINAALPLKFSYHRITDPGFIDSRLDITNPGWTAVAPTLALTAVDSDGHQLPEVQVSTAYGSDRGSLVVPSGASYDVLAFHGTGSDRVADVRVTVKDSAPVDAAPNLKGVEAQPTDASGAKLTRFDDFSAVTLTNPNQDSVTVRLVYLVYNSPAKGDPQLATSVTPIGDLITVPAHGSTTVQVTGDARTAVQRNSGRAAVSLKTYLSH